MKPLKYSEISKLERYISEVIDFHQQKYRYVGEEGKQYQVVQTLFGAINRLTELSNRQIRWYAVILNLQSSFYEYRRQQRWEGITFSQNKDQSFFKSIYDIKIDNEIYKVFPPYINELESYIINIARLGIILSTRQPANPDYFHKKINIIRQCLGLLLKQFEPVNEVTEQAIEFLLTIRNASDNLLKLIAIANEKNTEMPFSFPEFAGERYKKVILSRINCVPPEQLAKHHNMDAFWNGFIP